MAEHYKSSNAKETEDIAARLALRLNPGDVVALEGDLGAGKTAFAKGLAKGLGINSVVSSPTYTIMQRYEGRIPLSHFDLYRLSSPDELESVGFFDELGGGGVVAVEWPDRAGSALPKRHLLVRIEKGAGEQQREITISEVGQ